jgi:hypothetical protein
MNLTHGNHSHEVHVSDDGSLDTVISVDGIECRYSEADRHENGRIRLSWLRWATEDACDSGMLEDEA